MKPKGVLIWVIAVSMIFSVSLVFAHEGGGGGGGGGGSGGGGDGLTGQASGDSFQPPDEFIPSDTEFVLDDPHENTSSVEPTPVVEFINLPQEVEDGMIAIMVVGGSILIGYATAGQTIWIQAGAAGTYSAATTHIMNQRNPDPNSQSSPVRAAVTSAGVAFIPVPPPAQEAISQVLGQVPIPTPPSLNYDRSSPGGFVQTYEK